MQACMFARLHVCMHVCIYIYVYTCIPIISQICPFKFNMSLCWLVAVSLYPFISHIVSEISQSDGEMPPFHPRLSCI